MLVVRSGEGNDDLVSTEEGDDSMLLSEIALLPEDEVRTHMITAEVIMVTYWMTERDPKTDLFGGKDMCSLFVNYWEFKWSFPVSKSEEGKLYDDHVYYWAWTCKAYNRNCMDGLIMSLRHFQFLFKPRLVIPDLLKIVMQCFFKWCREEGYTRLEELERGSLGLPLPMILIGRVCDYITLSEIKAAEEWWNTLVEGKSSLLR